MKDERMPYDPRALYYKLCRIEHKLEDCVADSQVTDYRFAGDTAEAKAERTRLRQEEREKLGLSAYPLLNGYADGDRGKKTLLYNGTFIVLSELALNTLKRWTQGEEQLLTSSCQMRRIMLIWSADCTLDVPCTQNDIYDLQNAVEGNHIIRPSWMVLILTKTRTRSPLWMNCRFHSTTF